MENKITVSLSHEEMGLLISSLSEFLDYIEDIKEIQEEIECSCNSFQIAGACRSAVENLNEVRYQAKNLKAKLRLLNTKNNKKGVNANED